MKLKYRYIFIVSVILFLHAGSTMAEKYSKQGDLLYSALFNELMKQKLCSSFEDCVAKVPIYAENGDRVHFHIYACKDRNILAKTIEYIIRNGIIITKGVPINVLIFQETKEESLKSDGFFGKKKEIISLEINK